MQCTPKYLYLLFILISISPSILAQKSKINTSKVAVGTDVYELKYEYYTKATRDTVLNGLYLIKKSLCESRIDSSFSFFTVRGNYKENKREGDWQWKTGTLKPIGSGEYDNYHYQFHVDGKEFSTEGKFKSGVKTDIWKVFEWTIADSQIQDTLLYAELPFKDNMVYGDINIYQGQEHILAKVNQKELADGTWKFATKNNTGEIILTREWVFKNNFLSERIIHVNGKKHVMKFEAPTLSDGIEVQMEMSQNYFEIINLMSAVNDPITNELFKQNSNRKYIFFLETFEKLKSNDSIMIALTKNAEIPSIKAKLYKDPYSSEEEQLLQKIKVSINQTNSILNIIHQDPQINIAKLSIPEVEWLLEVIQVFKDVSLYPIQEFIRLKVSGNLEYIDRQKYISTFIKPISTLNIALNNKTGNLPTSYELASIESTLPISSFEQLMNYAINIEKEALKLSDSLKVYVFEFKKEEKLIDVEAELILRIEQVKGQIARLITDTHAKLAKYDVNVAINQFIDSELEKYSKIESSEAKLGRIDGLLQCIDNTEQLVRTLENVPENIYIVKDAYTRQSFNPYTLSTMEEKIKGPIYKAYEELILPAVFHNIKDLRCDMVLESNLNFQVLFQGMINLLGQDTHKLEKNIKKTNSPQRASDILDLKLKLY